MKHKVADLDGALLDAAAAKAEGRQIRLSARMRLVVGPIGYTGCDVCGEGYAPSTDWQQGGPIIERERIGLGFDGKAWCASPKGKDWSFGPTPLIAAMRAYAASKLGEEVEL